jgi:hypothetical protein
MAARLGVSRTTIRTHIQAVLTKLGVHSRLEAASVAVRYGLLDRRPGGHVTQYPARPGDVSPLPDRRSRPKDRALTTSGFPQHQRWQKPGESARLSQSG